MLRKSERLDIPRYAHGQGRMMALLTLAGGLLVSPQSWAQDPVPEVVPDDLKEEVVFKSEKPQGWALKAKVGLSGSLSKASKVVGTADGTTTQFGLMADGSAEWVRNQSEWLTTLNLQHTQTRTPVVPKFVKTADSLDLVSTFLYRIASIPWFGPYARVKGNTSLFPAYDVQPEVFQVRKPDEGKVDALGNPAAESVEAYDQYYEYALTKSFEPLLLGQSIGAFANPIEKKFLTIKTKAGAAAQELLTQESYAMKTALYEGTVKVDQDEDGKADLDADGKEVLEARKFIDVKQLEDTAQVGLELEVAINGELTSMISYTGRANLFYPAWSSVEQDTSGFDSVNKDLMGGLSLKLAKWISLDYQVTLKWIPVLIKEWQIQHGLILAANFDLL